MEPIAFNQSVKTTYNNSCKNINDGTDTSFCSKLMLPFSFFAEVDSDSLD